jgi:hypothetical protein
MSSAGTSKLHLAQNEVAAAWFRRAIDEAIFALRICRSPRHWRISGPRLSPAL